MAVRPRGCSCSFTCTAAMSESRLRVFLRNFLTCNFQQFQRWLVGWLKPMTGLENGVKWCKHLTLLTYCFNMLQDASIASEYRHCFYKFAPSDWESQALLVCLFQSIIEFRPHFIQGRSDGEIADEPRHAGRHHWVLIEGEPRNK